MGRHPTAAAGAGPGLQVGSGLHRDRAWRLADFPRLGTPTTGPEAAQEEELCSLLPGFGNLCKGLLRVFSSPSLVFKTTLEEETKMVCEQAMRVGMENSLLWGWGGWDGTSQVDQPTALCPVDAQARAPLMYAALVKAGVRTGAQGGLRGRGVDAVETGRGRGLDVGKWWGRQGCRLSEAWSNAHLLRGR